MLSIGKLKRGRAKYYLDTVARGAEEYYTGAKEAPGEWVGRGAELLRLAGEVDAEALHRVLEARDPATGDRLTRAQGAPRVPGFDTTFNAPKSVSLLFALGDGETSNEVRNAHDAAVGAAWCVLESEAARARRGKGGLERVVADGLVGASFRHRTSRAADPHLHTHVVAANVVQAPHDRRWSALDARGLYPWAKTVGYLYEAHLRADLTRRLGVAWRPVHNGIAEIVGVPDGVLRGFSRRSQDIQAHLAEHGESGARAAQVATYATRKAKDVEVPAEGLLPEWRSRAASLGLDAATLRTVLARTQPGGVFLPGTPERESLFRRLASPAGLTAKASTFGRREVIQAICEALPQGGRVAEILELADDFLRSPHVVALNAPERLRSSDVIRRSDGRVVRAHVDETRWSTPEMLAVERGLLISAVKRRRARAGVADWTHVATAIASHSSLSEEQETVVKRITRLGAGVDVVVGAAGTGKTHALAAAREAWQASGYRVVGAALAARAAAELEEGAGIRSITLHRLVRGLDQLGPGALDAQTVVVLDEAGMVGTRQLARLLEHAERARAKVVLVGDHHQLPAIDAGGAFAGLAARLGPSELVENRRQRAPWERAALAQLRDGDPETAFRAYQRHDRVVHGDDGGAVRERLVDDWWAARAQGGSQIMLATRNRDVDDLNHRARRRLASAGKLGHGEVMVGGRAFAVGDEILATRNDYDIPIFNGTRATITGLDPRTGTIHARTGVDRQVAFPRSYVEAGHLSHAYAITIHKAQGMTVHHTFLLADDALDRERAYSAMSRGSDRNALYVVASADERAEERHAPEAATEAVARARAAVRRTIAKSMAVDHHHEPTMPERPLGPDLGL